MTIHEFFVPRPDPDSVRPGPPAWDPNRTYVSGDRVTYDGRVWITRGSRVTSSPTGGSGDWHPIIGLSNGQFGQEDVETQDRPAWSESTRYAAGEIVSHNGELWAAQNTHSGSTPHTNNDNWYRVSSEEGVQLVRPMTGLVNFNYDSATMTQDGVVNANGRMYTQSEASLINPEMDKLNESYLRSLTPEQRKSILNLINQIESEESKPVKPTKRAPGFALKRTKSWDEEEVESQPKRDKPQPIYAGDIE